MQDYYLIIFYVGGIQGFILTIFLFSLKKNMIANRFLGLLTLGWGILLTLFALQFEGFFRENPHFLKTFSHLPVCFFPLLFLNVKYLIRKHTKFYYQDLLHFLPFVISIFLYAGFYFKSGDEKIMIIRSDSGYYHHLDNITDEFLALQGIIYSIVVIYWLLRYKRQARNYISNVDKKLVQGTLWGTVILLVSWIIGSVAVTLRVFNVEVSVDLFFIVYLLIVICIYWISYYAIKSPEIFKIDMQEYNKDILSESVKEEEDPELEQLNQQLLSYIKEHQPYLDSELSLQDLARKLNISRHQLSALINSGHGKNFYEFINYHRVEEVKRLMEQPESKNLKLIALAYDAGFNSKATFNRIFKQFTNKTPSEYQATKS